MNRHTFIWGIPRYQVKSKERWLEFAYFINLWIGAILLLTTNLGALPLGDWEVSTLTQVAKEIYQSSFQDWHWLFPTMGGEPYLHQPPLIHSLTALVYHFLGINEFSSRIVGASLTSLSVPLLYLVAKELFLPRYYALFSALVYLTTLPLVKYGRLAVLDGSVLCFYTLFLLFILKTRRDLRWSYLAGISLTLTCLCQGWQMALLLSAIAGLFIYWDTPRLIFSLQFWAGIILGITPAISWYWGEFFYYGTLDSGLGITVNHYHPIWHYLTELLAYSYPWIFFACLGWQKAWQNQNWSWAKLILVTTFAYVAIIFFFGINQSWTLVPIYPSLSLAAGFALAEIKSMPSFESYPPLLIRFFTLLTVVLVGGLIYSFTTIPNNYNLLTVLGLLLITFATVTILLSKKDPQFIYILLWGMYVTLIVFFSSNYWFWELNEKYAVKPIANVIQEVVPYDEDIYIDAEDFRSSLNFYSDRQIIPIDQKQLEKLWQTPSYLLIRKNILSKLDFVPQNGIYCNPELKLNSELSSSQLSQLNCVQEIAIENSDFILFKPIKIDDLSKYNQ
jgi:4-amino-4-deoxy-L-arabinose transferase-like glycosyltransferase